MRRTPICTGKTNSQDMNTMTFLRFTPLLCAALLAACTTPPPAPKPPDESRAMIEAALRRADTLPAHTRGADSKAPAAVTTGESVSINYVGEARDLLRQVSAARGLTFRVSGPQPHLPLFVLVDVNGVSFEEFLGDVGSQFGQRASLALTDSSIEVRYRGQ
jgi:hypothetical protein